MSFLKTTPIRYLTLFVLVIVALLAVTLWAAMKFVAPLPPRTVVMTTGPLGSAHHNYAMRYQEILAREDIELHLIPSNGELANLERLRNPASGVSVGFVEGGSVRADDASHLVSLGTVFYEPIWIFYRGGLSLTRREDFQGLRMAVGPKGSSTRRAILQLIAMNQLLVETEQLLPLRPRQAAEALQQGRIDLAAMVAPWDSPVVRTLLGDPGIETMSYPRADAYVALFPHLSRLVVPAGVGDMAAHRPPSDVVLIAPKSSLVVQRDLHPAIQYLLLEAAAQTHGGPGIFQKAGQFPAAESLDLPLSPDARRYYASGPTFLHRYLPFWAAIFVGQVLVVVIPFLAVVYPIVRFTPTLFSWLMHRRIYRHYGQLKDIEDQDDRRAASPQDLIAQLDALEAQLAKLRVPLAYSDRLFLLRQHVQLIRDELGKRKQAPPAPDQNRGVE